MNTTDLLISVSVVITLRLWQSGAIQALVNRGARKLPQWAQPVPPIALSVLATVAVWLVQGPSEAALVDTLADGGIVGAVTVGLYHVAKRWTPAGIVGKVRAAAKSSTVLLVLLAGCSSSRVEPEVYSADRLVSVLSGAVDLVDAVSAEAIASLPADCSEETAQLARDVTARVGETRAAVAALEDGRAEVCVTATQISKLATLAAALDEQASQGAALVETVRKLAGCE